jgi:DNA-binding LytR/AlgR family response regulator
MKQLQIMVVEDEPIIAQEISMVVEDLGYQVCALVMHGSEVAKTYSKCNPDLLLMDINLGHGEDGITLVKNLMLEKKTPFIFVTSYADKHTLDRAKAVNPDGYVVKPFDERDLQAAIEIAFSRFEQANSAGTEQEENNTQKDNFLINQHLFVRHKNKLVRLHPEHILYAEASSNYTQIVTLDQTYVVSSHLAIIEQKLVPHGFIRVHRSYIVNLAHVESVEDDLVVLNNKAIPLSRNARSVLLKSITQL